MKAVAIRQDIKTLTAAGSLKQFGCYPVAYRNGYAILTTYAGAVAINRKTQEAFSFEVEDCTNTTPYHAIMRQRIEADLFVDNAVAVAA